ncbi:PDZ domain-containing protein [Candidatus Gracilibacteria bacterium]|nr:PDZ domain-containing protein [Candidatus Gracilibacteria bacterium]
MFLGIIVALIVFSFIVLVHEYGHFKTARIFGVKVFEFGLGIPPKAKKLWIDKSGTEYTLNWLPIGGFVRMKGENLNYFQVYDKSKKIIKHDELKKVLESDIEVFDVDQVLISRTDKELILEKLKENDDKDNLLNKPYWQQSIVILAGVFMNFVLAIIIFTILFTLGVKPVGINDKIDTNLDIMMFPTIEQSIEKGLLKINNGVLLSPLTGSLAEKSGIKMYDLLLKIDGNDAKNTDYVKNIISKSKNKELTLNIEREGKILDIKLKIGTDGKIGAYLGTNYEFNRDFRYQYNFPESFFVSSKEVYNETLLTFKALGVLVSKLVLPKTKQDREEAMESVGGPIAIAGVINDAMKAGFSILMILAALISINLGAFNLLPIPALDGGRFLFMTVNKLITILTGKKGISPQIEGLIHLSFFVILIILSIIVAYNDIINIVKK